MCSCWSVYDAVAESAHAQGCSLPFQGSHIISCCTASAHLNSVDNKVHTVLQSADRSPTCRVTEHRAMDRRCLHPPQHALSAHRRILPRFRRAPDNVLLCVDHQLNVGYCGSSRPDLQDAAVLCLFKSWRPLDVRPTPHYIYHCCCRCCRCRSGCCHHHSSSPKRDSTVCASARSFCTFLRR